MNNIIKLFLLLFSVTAFAQKARIKGVVLNEENLPVKEVTISCNGQSTISNVNGFYTIEVDANKKLTLVFSHLTYKKTTINLQLKTNEDFEYNPVLNDKIEEIGTVLVTGKNKRKIDGATAISPIVIRRIPGANAGVENLIKSLPGASGNNEFSTTYTVRGGNYDENLVYVNEIEVYRPFLVRSGQQEGLSFTNTDLVESIDFYAGGFQAKYGDKLSSVLDINYRNPTKFQAGFEASLLGASLFAEGVSKNQKWSNITGVRYRNNTLLVNSQDIQTNYKPSFFDVQSQVNYFHNTKWNFSFLGNISQNVYNYEPTSRQTNFGTLSEPIALVVLYDGQEKDKYLTFFGAIKSNFEPNKKTKIRLINSVYQTIEQEYYDIFAQYRLGEIDSNIGSETFGDVTFSRGVGSQLNHARNNLNAIIVTNEVKGTHKLNSKNTVEWSVKHNYENIKDRIVEWEVIDSAGFSLPPPIVNYVNDQPYNPYNGPLAAYKNIRALNNTVINRFLSYVNYNYSGNIGEHKFYVNAGLRGQAWQVKNNNQSGNSILTFSPRAQFIFKPKWEKDMVFRFSTGVYNQPPFYRELRDEDGIVNPNVKDQKSIHFVLGHDYSFSMWNRPFKLVSEAYYKTQTNVNTYTIDNVRIRYEANNDATAFVYGFDARLNGEFVPGVESWFTFGYLKTEENQNNRGFIARPTDQRLKFAILFQDYMPNIPSLKMYLNLVYNTGLPGGSPAYADPYEFQFRLNDYKRADAGFSYVFKDAQLGQNKKWLQKVSEFSLGFEIFNMFNNQNAITNTWVRDVYSKTQYGVPNYLSTRTFNLKMSIRI
jgi:hypothetical protein